MKNKHRGSNFEDFLKEEGIFEECHTEAVKRVIAFQLEKAKADKISVCKNGIRKTFRS